MLARATPRLDRLLSFRGINPLYGDFLSELLPKGSRSERIQALESVLELSGAVARAVPVPDARRLDPGPLETGWLDPELARQGLSAGSETTLREKLMEAGPGPTLAAKLRVVFDGRFAPGHPIEGPAPSGPPGISWNSEATSTASSTAAAWSGRRGSCFATCSGWPCCAREFSALPNWDPACIQDLQEVALALRRSCRRIDPDSTDRFLDRGAAGAASFRRRPGSASFRRRTPK